MYENPGVRLSDSPYTLVVPHTHCRGREGGGYSVCCEQSTPTILAHVFSMGG